MKNSTKSYLLQAKLRPPLPVFCLPKLYLSKSTGTVESTTMSLKTKSLVCCSNLCSAASFSSSFLTPSWNSPFTNPRMLYVPKQSLLKQQVFYSKNTVGQLQKEVLTKRVELELRSGVSVQQLNRWRVYSYSERGAGEFNLEPKDQVIAASYDKNETSGKRTDTAAFESKTPGTPAATRAASLGASANTTVASPLGTVTKAADVSNGTESLKQEVVSITYEEIGLFPRSFNRVFDRFFKQLFSDVENLVIQEYRFYRYLFLTTIKCLFILFFVPFLVNFLAKNYLVKPLTEYYWNSKQPEIFLNFYQQERAFSELHDFEEKIYFESLIAPLATEKKFSTGNLSDTVSMNSLSLHKESSVSFDTSTREAGVETTLATSIFPSPRGSDSVLVNATAISPVVAAAPLNLERVSKDQLSKSQFVALQSQHPKDTAAQLQDQQNSETTVLKSSMIVLNKVREGALQHKIEELAIFYNDQSIQSINNFFADLMSFLALCFLFSRLEVQINITKSFLLEVFFGLDDSKKSLLILLITDLLVGYHSSNLWELFFQFCFYHYGLPENETTIFLLVATLPVLLDVLFKYLIFRHLNRASPATVATYHAMIE